MATRLRGHTVNIQPRERRALEPSGTLQVHSIFMTIQGEGPFCGTPCVFVRLAGCNLQCPACDTDYTSDRALMRPGEILFEINELWRKDKWRPGLVVITGGEPFRQNLARLFTVLINNGYHVQVETNGTLPFTPFAYQRVVNNTGRSGVYVVCSPKTPKVHHDVYDHACALKYVVEAGHADPTDGLPTSALRMPNPPARPPVGWLRPVYVQPLDTQDPEQNAAHAREAVASCLRHGYTLQVQIHKVVGVE